MNTADKLGITSIVLYEKNGSSWTKLNSAYNKFGYNARSYGYTISAPAVEGRQYKVTVSFYGKIGDLTDTHTQSQTSTYYIKTDVENDRSQGERGHFGGRRQ